MAEAQKRLIVGTAGHIDHGKTALVMALTGYDTDRLPEEKKRGISIGLGFAPLPLTPDLHLAFIDVPGHERFIKTMLLGASSFDLALLVVAADRGIMPQTREHLAILHLLGISCGLVAITKIDLVPAATLAARAEEVRALLAPTALKDSPLVFVSCKTGQGLAECRAVLQRLAAGIAPKQQEGPARLPVDRVFTVRGFGTVVTGSLWSGRLHQGDSLVLWPGEREVKIRRLEVHGAAVPTALAGQRVACNLAAIGKEEIHQTCLAGRQRALYGQPLLRRAIFPAQRGQNTEAITNVFLFIMGRASFWVACICWIREELAPGSTSFGQLLLEEPLFALPQDTLILRSYSPNETIGKAAVLQVAAPPPQTRRLPRRFQYRKKHRLTTFLTALPP